ncbi:MAG TPA: universal stress protein [Candidatus Nitrosotalea sp.]|nr:universal stress protein [Candidatus Nitrosotalea sp.]
MASLAQLPRRAGSADEATYYRMKVAMESKAAGTAKVRPLPLSSRIKSILVPIDFSPPSIQALKHAAALARLFKAKLTLLHIVEPVATPDFAASFPLEMENYKLNAAARRHLEGVVKAARIAPGIVERVLVRFGRSYNEITEAARTLKVDLIIISTHGYTGWKHALLGSTTERVVRHAPCPVLVVRRQ